MLKISFVSLCALVGVVGLAQAQTYDPSIPRGERRETVREERRLETPHTVAFKDEYGFRYDAQGDRLDARGYVMAPPVTPPGAAALR
jgi:hypothetical protein